PTPLPPRPPPFPYTTLFRSLIVRSPPLPHGRSADAAQPRRDPRRQGLRPADRRDPAARSAAHYRSVLSHGDQRGSLDRRGAQRRHGRRGALRSGAVPRQYQGRRNRPDQQRPHDPRAARLDLSDAVFAGEVPASAAIAERLVHPGRARYLDPASLQIPRPLRDDEGRPGALAALWPDRV